MSVIDRQIRRTRIRLLLNAAWNAGALGLLIAGTLWSLTIVVERTFVFGLPLGTSAAASAAAGLIIAGIATNRARFDALTAALELDQAAGLKERISSALVYRGHTDPFAQAVVVDAERIAGSVHVPSHVKYRPPALWPWSAASFLASLLCFLFMPVLDLLAGAQRESVGDESTTVQEKQAIEAALQTQLRKFQERLAEKPALADLRGEIEKLQLPNEPTKTPEDIRREAVKRIENVADKWRERLEADDLRAHDQLKRDLAKLETPGGDDHASKLMEALSAGDMNGAQAALSKLKQELENAAKNGDAEAKKRLNETAEKLEDFAKQLEKLAEQQKTEKDLENKGGLTTEQAKQLLRELDGKTPEEIAKELQKRLTDSGLTKQQIEQMARKIAQEQQTRRQLRDLAKAMSQLGKT